MGTNHAVTETATWDAAPPVVPDADADMDDATSIIEAFVTKLGSRTKYLYAAIAAIPAAPSLADYARKSVVNVFSAANTFTASIETRDINVRNGRNIDVEGGVHADGTITSDSNIETALDMVARDFDAARDVNAAGRVSAPTLHSDDDTQVGRDALVTRNVTVGAIVKAQRFQYPSGFRIGVNLALAQASALDWRYLGNVARQRPGLTITGAWCALYDDVDLYVPIVVPFGWVHREIEVAHYLPADRTPGNRFVLTVDGVTMNATPIIDDGVPKSPESSAFENSSGWHRITFYWPSGFELPASSTMTLRCTAATGGDPLPGGSDGSMVARVTCTQI